MIRIGILDLPGLFLIQEIIDQLEESTVIHHGEDDEGLLWPLFLRAITFEDQKV